VGKKRELSCFAVKYAEQWKIKNKKRKREKRCQQKEDSSEVDLMHHHKK